MEKKLIGLLFIVTLILCGLMGCENNTTFNESKAKVESREQLDKLLNSNKNNMLIAKNTEMDKIKSFVQDNLFSYMTKDFQNDIKNNLSKNAYSRSSEIFFLSSDDDVFFYNGYDISSPTVDKKNETVTYELTATGQGLPPTTSVNVEMKKENGAWKINKVS